MLNYDFIDIYFLSLLALPLIVLFLLGYFLEYRRYEHATIYIIIGSVCGGFVVVSSILLIIFCPGEKWLVILNILHGFVSCALFEFSVWYIAGNRDYFLGKRRASLPLSKEVLLSGEKGDDDLDIEEHFKKWNNCVRNVFRKGGETNGLN